MLTLSKSLVQDHLGWLVLGLQHHRRSMRKAASQCLGRKEGEGKRNGWKEKEKLAFIATALFPSLLIRSLVMNTLMYYSLRRSALTTQSSFKGLID